MPPHRALRHLPRPTNRTPPNGCGVSQPYTWTASSPTRSSSRSVTPSSTNFDACLSDCGDVLDAAKGDCASSDGPARRRVEPSRTSKPRGRCVGPRTWGSPVCSSYLWANSPRIFPDGVPYLASSDDRCWSLFAIGDAEAVILHLGVRASGQTTTVPVERWSQVVRRIVVSGLMVVVGVAVWVVPADAKALSSASNGEATKSAETILADAKAATKASASVAISGTAIDKGKRFSFNIVSSRRRRGRWHHHQWRRDVHDRGQPTEGVSQGRQGVLEQAQRQPRRRSTLRG